MLKIRIKKTEILMYRMELKQLRGISYTTEQKNLMAIAETLTKLGTIPQVQMQRERLEDILSSDFWDGITFSQLEMVRQALRGLVQFIGSNGAGRIVYTDFTDTVLAVQEHEHEPGPTEYAITAARWRHTFVRTRVTLRFTSCVPTSH